jgi:hypothetical protein
MMSYVRFQKMKVNIFLQHFNYIEPSIQFTVEREGNGQLIF